MGGAPAEPPQTAKGSPAPHELSGSPAPADNRSALWLLVEEPRFAAYLGCRFLSMVAWQIVSVTIGWLIYERTGTHLLLGMVGLAQFIPALICVVPGGLVADRNDRRTVIGCCYVVLAFLCALLAWVGLASHFSLPLYFTLLVLLGVVRSFNGPAGQAIIPALVPRERLSRAVSLGSVLSTSAFFVGPSFAGLVIDALETHSKGQGAHAFSIAGGMFLLALLLLFRAVPKLHVPDPDDAKGLTKVMQGLRFVVGHKPILGALSLDMFAVLLGGVTALLPVFARDLLDAGPRTFGMLRAAPGLGALCMSLVLLFWQIKRRAGVVMFASVFVFGLATVVFAYSANLWLSLGMLFVLGAADVISVVIRATLIQLWSPDSMRGRISAVNLVFLSSSNELGEFESGLTAEWLGTRRAAALGGLGTCLVVLLWMRWFPALRKTDSLESPG